MKAIIFLADGFEEVEALATVDVLRRGGVEVVLVSVDNQEKQTGARQIQVVTDEKLDAISLEDVDAIILPGGMPGTLNLKNSEKVCQLVKEQAAAGKLVCAICAAPIVLGYCGILYGRNATCYPGFEEELKGATVQKDKVVEDGMIITSRGVGTALDFGLTILNKLTNSDNAKKIGESILHL